MHSIDWYCCLVAELCPTLQPHELQHTRLPCPSLSTRVCSSGPIQPSNPVSPTPLLPSIFPILSCLSMSRLFASGSQRIGASTLASVLPVNIQGWFPLGLIGLISLLSKGLSRVFSSTTIWKHQLFGIQPSLWSTSHIHTRLLEKTIALTRRSFLAKWRLCFLIHCLGLSWLFFQGASVV